jgi:hypothetical protein
MSRKGKSLIIRYIERRTEITADAVNAVDGRDGPLQL